MRRRELERLETTYLLDKVDLMERDINLQFRAQARTREANNIILSGISTVSAVLGGFVVASLVEAPLDFSNESYVPVNCLSAHLLPIVVLPHSELSTLAGPSEAALPLIILPFTQPSALAPR